MVQLLGQWKKVMAYFLIQAKPLRLTHDPLLFLTIDTNSNKVSNHYLLQ